MGDDFFTDCLCYFCINTAVDSGVNRASYGTWDPSVGYHTTPDGRVISNPPPEPQPPLAQPAQPPLLGMAPPAGSTMNREGAGRA